MELEFRFVQQGYTAITETHKFNHGGIGLYLMYKNFNTNKDSIRIIRLDSTFNQTFEWSREVAGRSSPRGCVVGRRQPTLPPTQGPA